MKKGMLVEIYKNRGQSYDVGAFSSKFNEVILIPNKDFPNLPELLNHSNDCPPIVIIKRKIAGNLYLTAYPADKNGNPEPNRMTGGCFIYSSNSRFKNGCSE